MHAAECYKYTCIRCAETHHWCRLLGGPKGWGAGGLGRVLLDRLPAALWQRLLSSEGKSSSGYEQHQVALVGLSQHLQTHPVILHGVMSKLDMALCTGMACVV